MKDKQKLDFSTGLKELEEITKWFESDEIDLNQALVKFERGMELASELKEYLGQFENRVEKIKRQFEASNKTETPEAEEPESVTEPESSSDPDLFSL